MSSDCAFFINDHVLYYFIHVYFNCSWFTKDKQKVFRKNYGANIFFFTNKPIFHPLQNVASYWIIIPEVVFFFFFLNCKYKRSLCAFFGLRVFRSFTKQYTLIIIILSCTYYYYYYILYFILCEIANNL